MPMIDVGGIRASFRLDMKPFNQGLLQALASSKAWANATGNVVQAQINRRATIIAAQSKAQVSKIIADADAAAMRAAAAAKVRASRVQSQAQAGATMVRAHMTAPAQAQAILMKAQAVAPAQAQATIMRAEANQDAQIIRAEAAAAAAATRAQGSAAAQMVRARGSAAAQMVKAQTRRAEAALGKIARLFTGVKGFAGGAFMGATGMLPPTNAFAAGMMGGNMLAASAREAIDMEDRMFRLARVTGFAGDRLRNLGDQFKNMAANMTGVRLEDVFDIAEMGAKLGVTGPKLAMFTADVSKLRAVIDEADIPLAEMVTGIARLSSVFHHGTEDTIRFAAVINRLDLESTASARDILNVSQRMSGFASMAGMTARQTMALATALRQAGVPIETAGTSIGQILQRMASTRDIGQFARMAGKTRGEFEKLIRVNPFEAIRSVAGGLAGMDFLSASRALEKVHLDGQRVRGTELALGRVLKELDKYLRDANQEWETQSSILGGFNARAETTGAQIALMWNNAKLLAAEIGKHMLPVIKGFGAGVVDLTRDLKAFLQANEARFKGWGDSVGRVFGDVKLLFTNFSDVMTVASFKVGEKWDKFVAIATRGAGFLKTSFVATFRYIADVASQVFDNMLAKLHNKLADVLNPVFDKMPGWMRPGQIDKVAVPRVDFAGPAMNFVKPAQMFQDLFVRGGILKNLPQRQMTPDQAKAAANLAKREKELADERVRGAKAIDMANLIERAKQKAVDWIGGIANKVVAMKPPDKRTPAQRRRDAFNARRRQFNAMMRPQGRPSPRAIANRPAAGVKPAAPKGGIGLGGVWDAMVAAAKKGPRVQTAAERRKAATNRLARERQARMDERKRKFEGAMGPPEAGPQASNAGGAGPLTGEMASLKGAVQTLTRAMEGIERMMAAAGQVESPWADMPRI